jgi:hypothetical protein
VQNLNFVANKLVTAAEKNRINYRTITTDNSTEAEVGHSVF